MGGTKAVEKPPNHDHNLWCYQASPLLPATANQNRGGGYGKAVVGGIAVCWFW